MSLFSQQQNTDKWKNKYFQLLNENEDIEKSHKDNEELLCKTIIRLCLATSGFNKELDPYLFSIRKQLKNGLKSEQLKSELEIFSNALMTLEEPIPNESTADASLLFDFLINHFPDQKNALKRLEAKFENNAFPNSQYLFIAISDLVDSIQQIEPISEFESITHQLNQIDPNIVNEQLLNLLDGAEIPANFVSQALKLKEKIINNVSLPSIFDETISLLFNIKKHVQSEQQEMAKFLAQLTDQLTELGIQASGVQSNAKSTAENINLLDQSVTTQVIELQKNSRKATKLEPLKKLINTRLADIAEQIKAHQVQYEIDRKKVHQDQVTLSLKIYEMEQETRQLKNRLINAHQKAIRDPLTNLPNRLAYDERLVTEVARWKRYQSPLSLLIWDIDFFKHINDNFGHKAGDKTLILIANLLSQHCRETDFVSRFGGEEFTMLLSDTNAQSAFQTANKLRQVIEKTAFHSHGKKISITISCGITQFIDGDTGECAFNRADKALYDAKNNGRNQCIVG